MKDLVDDKVYIIVPNWNGADDLPACLDSLVKQTRPAKVIVVDNASTDGSAELVENRYPKITVLYNPCNYGFAGGVNVGIKHAINLGAKYVALFNNDAVADRQWLERLVSELTNKPKLGIATSKICDANNKHLDSTGDLYTIWGLPYPRGRGEPVSDKYDKSTNVFGASGGASLYRVSMLYKIGLFDEDFFAYYEDVDLSFRAQLAGWKVSYVPSSVVYHKIGATSSRIKDFTTYQTMKNLPMLAVKNVPARLMPKILPRFLLAYFAFYFSAIGRGQGWAATKGLGRYMFLKPKKLAQRYNIQKGRMVSSGYINSILTHDLPPNAQKLRALRSKWWRIAR